MLANKQDMPSAVAPDKVAEALHLHTLRSHEWYLQPCSAVSGNGLYEGLDWLHRTLRDAPRRTAAGG